MPIIVNQHELTDAEVEQEIAQHQDAANPLKSATTAVVLRHLLLDEATRLHIEGADDEMRIDSLLALAVPVLEPDRDACLRHYQQHPQHFTVGELVEVDHILFQVTPGLPLEALRIVAQQTLDEILETPELFGDRARTLSNCPSGAVGGNLGQLGRGDSVAEFERVVFGMSPGLVLPRLLETRFGLHIVRLIRRIEGRLLPFEQVADAIASALQQANRDIAWRQFLQVLVGAAHIEGIELDGLSTPLVQ